MQEASKAAEVEPVDPLLLPGIGCPGLAAVQEGGQDASLVDEKFGLLTQQTVAPHLLVEFGHDTGGFCISYMTICRNS